MEGGRGVLPPQIYGEDIDNLKSNPCYLLRITLIWYFNDGRDSGDGNSNGCSGGNVDRATAMAAVGAMGTAMTAAKMA
jgi:hypothetical protein